MIPSEVLSINPSANVSLWRLYPVGKKTFTTCLKDVLRRQARHLTKTSTTCPKEILNANLKDIFVRHLEDTFARYIVDVLQRRLKDGLLIYLEDALNLSEDVS